MSSIRNVVFGFVLGLSLVVCSSARADVIKGELDDDNPERAYKVMLKPKTKYLFYMTSNQVDSYLYFMDAKGTILDKNDDLAKSTGTMIPTLDSRIITNTKDDGVYQLKASSYMKKGRGEFQLFVGTPEGTAKVSKGKITKKSPKFGQQRLPYVAMAMKLEKGTVLKLTASSSDFDALLGVRMKDGKKMLASDDNSGGGKNALAYFLVPKAGEYEILVGSLNRALGEYEFTVQAYQGADGVVKK